MVATTLAELARRPYTVWGGLRTRPYNMSRPPGTGDCSSFVAAVLGLDNPNAWSTVNLIDVLVPIDFAQAEPGDFWGKIGPGTGGAAGHIASIVGTPRTRGTWLIVEQSGPQGVYGPVERPYLNPPAGYRAYRSKFVTSTPGGIEMFCQFGQQGQTVQAMQHLILAAGGQLPGYGPDGDFGPETAAALASLVGGDGRTYGPAQYAALMVRVARKQANPPAPAAGIQPGSNVTITGKIAQG